MKRNRFISTQFSPPFEWQWGTDEESKYAAGRENTMTGIADEFLHYTSIHGMRYIGERERPLLERMFWLVFVVAGCTFSVYGCYLEWEKWNQSSILITRDPTTVTHEPLVFPIVSLCSTNKISKKKLENVLQDSKYSWMNYTMLLKTLRYMTKYDSLVKPDETFPHLIQMLTKHNVTTQDLAHTVSRVSPTCNELVVDCQWKSSVVPCDRLFFTRLTDDGICCSTDVSELDEAQQEMEILHKNSNTDRPSGIVHDYGVHSAMRLMLNPNVFDNALGGSTFDGFKVLLHNKEEFPDVTERGFIIGAGHDHNVALDSLHVWYTEAIPKIPFEKRSCYVKDERSLKFQKDLKYTRSSCLFECRAEAIIRECHCLPYFIANILHNISTPLCELAAYPCVANFYGGRQASLGSYCQCPATCNDHWFTNVISTVPLSANGFPATRSFNRVLENRHFNMNDSMQIVGVRIFFKYNAGDSFKMDVPYGNKELLASMGGLLGFGLGFSAISAVELCFFLCCSWCCRKKRNILEPICVWTPQSKRYTNKKNTRQFFRRMYVAPLKYGTEIRTISSK